MRFRKKPKQSTIQKIELGADTPGVDTDNQANSNGSKSYLGRILSNRYLLSVLFSTGPISWMFKASDVVLRRDVAVKVLRPHVLEDADFLDRFRSQAIAAAQLNHINIAAIYDWDIDGAPYLITELCRGSSLRDMLDDTDKNRASKSVVAIMGEKLPHSQKSNNLGGLTPSQVISIGIQATEALGYAHSKGIIHQDLSPSNILFDVEGRVKLSDFEVASMFRQRSSLGIAGRPLLLHPRGTSYYAAPEQLEETTSFTEKTDIYSLALILLEALLGEFPFSGETSIETYLKRLNEPLEIPPDLGELGDVLSLALKLNPEQRPSTKELLWYLKGLSQYQHSVPLPIYMSAGMLETTKVDWKKYAPNVEQLKNKEPSPVLADDPQPDNRQLDDVQIDVTPQLEPSLYSDSDPAQKKVKTKIGERKISKLGIAVSGLIVLSAAFLSAFSIYSWTSNTDEFTVPDLTGSVVEALESIDDKWEVQRFEMRSDDYPLGTIIMLEPPPGSKLKKDEVLNVTVSLGEAYIRLPSNLLGSTLAEVEIRLAGLGLKMGSLTLLQTVGQNTTYVPITPNEANFQADIVEGYDVPISELPRGSEVPLLVRRP